MQNLLQLLKDAIANGIDFEVLNENKSTVEFRGHGNIEFVIEEIKLIGTIIFSQLLLMISIFLNKK